MRRENAGTLLVVASVLVLAAICGYVVGKGRSSNPSAEAALYASNANATVEYPQSAGWRPAARVPPIAGLSFSQPLVLAPAGDPSRAGLIAGQLVNRGWSPLPQAFLAAARELPKTEVVGLVNSEAYKYTGVQTGTPARAFTLYTIPSSSAREASVMCFAPAAGEDDMHTCEGIAASLIVNYPAGVAAITDITPEATYSRQISAALERVNQLRMALRAGVGGRAVPTTVAKLSVQLADGLTNVLDSLSPVRPPGPAEQVHAALLSSLSNTGAAYSSLAAAASAGDQEAYSAALQRIAAAEANLNGVLAAFSLLGYK
jgi:hypothetical protein